MAKCDEGYFCEVCGKDVANITESDLYLRFVIGMVDPETLHTTPDRHIRCNPSMAQFIVEPGFESIEVEGEFDKRKLDPEFVAAREQLVTRGWKRLGEVKDQEMPIYEYVLPEFAGKWSEP